MSATFRFFGIIVITISLLNKSGKCLQNMDYQNQGGGILLNKIIKTPWNDENLSADDIRCYCDLPVCIATGYMCRTARSSYFGSNSDGEDDPADNLKSGGCFLEINEFGDNADITRRHGCVELLNDENKQIQCDNIPRKHTDKNTNNEVLLLCCQNDMCNHIDNPENKKITKQNLTTINSAVTSGGSGTDSTVTSAIQVDEIPNVKSGNFPSVNSQLSLMGVYPVFPPYTDDTNNELWFKIATIAVPILGAIILFLLVALAIRMLKTDNMDTSSTKLHRSNSLSHVIAGVGSGQFSGTSASSTNTHYLSGGEHGKIVLDQYNSPLLLKDHQHHHNITADNLSKLKTINTTNNNCDNKNEALAKRNQLINLEYSLLPQSCNDPNVKLTNTEDGVINDVYSKNFNYKSMPSSLLSTQNNSYYLNDKCYEKEVLNPVAANWNN